MKNKEIINIITKSFADILNEEEQHQLDCWVSKSLENKAKYEGYRRLWEQARTLASHEDIDVEAALVKTKKHIKEFRAKKRINFYIPRVAAILLVLISLAFALKYFFNNSDFPLSLEQTVFQEVKAAYGMRTKLLLADGTNVWLNSGSTLRFPLSFHDMDQRKVELVGEGYFEVTKNVVKPFIVKTPELDVKVHGTSFNVLAHEEYNSTVVALVEGKVSLIKDYNGKQRELMVLRPHDVVEFNSGDNTLHRTADMKMNKYTSWKDGYILFYGDPIDKVVQRLEKWYNVDIEIADKALEDYRFTATFYDESLEQVLKLLSLSSPIEYKITPAQKLKDNSFSMRKVILTGKLKQ